MAVIIQRINSGKRFNVLPERWEQLLCVPVLQLYYLLHDEHVPLQHKAYIIGALGYFILPLDFIPETILAMIGYTDDIAVMGLVLKLVKDSLTPEIKAKVEAKITELLHTDDI